MTTVGLYLRVSTAEQAERYSLPAQRRDLVECAERQGWEYKVLEDAGISGETLDARPAMLRLLELARTKQIQVALAVEMERFSRSESLFDWLVIKQAFREGGVRFGTPAQLYDPADAEDDFLTDLFGALSKREKRKFVARAMRGKLEASRRGRYISLPPYGYRSVGPGQGSLVVYEPEAEIVRLLFSLILQGWSTRKLVGELERRGIPTPRGGRRWNTGTIWGLLTKRTYSGIAYFNQYRRKKSQARMRLESDWIAVPVPRIVSDETFRRAQEALRRNAWLCMRNQRRFYLLKGLVRCGVCGRAMVGKPRNGKRHYMCASRMDLDRSRRCGAKMIRADALEDFVWGELVRMLRKPDVVLNEIRRWHEGHVTERDDLSMRLAGVEHALQKIPGERERILAAYREGWIAPEETRTQLAVVERKHATLQQERGTLESRIGARTVTEEKAANLEAVLQQIGDRLDVLDDARRFTVVHAFVERIVVMLAGEVWIHASVPTPPAEGVHCAAYVKSP